MSVNLGVRQHLWASTDAQMGVKHGNLADAQAEKSGSLPAILRVILSGLPLNLYTDFGIIGMLVQSSIFFVESRQVPFVVFGHKYAMQA